MKFLKSFFYIVLLSFILSSTNIKFAQLNAANFCYKYAFFQKDKYLTQKNDGSKDLNIVADVKIDEPIELRFFIQNLTDDEITDVFVNITDINTTQATYINNSTKLRKKNVVSKQLYDESDLNVSSEYIKDINVGKVLSNDDFYVYFKLKPKKSKLDLHIDVEVSYNLATQNKITQPYTLKLGSDIPICSRSSFTYAPAKGIFNIVHNNYYNDQNNYYYNLPTQVTYREGNFRVISLDPSDFETPRNVSTIVAVEIIDASSSLDASSSCLDMTSSISPRVWMVFEQNVSSVNFDKEALKDAISNGMTKLSSSSEFYSQAKENAAFRISYNTTNDANESLVKILPDGVGYKIENFSPLVEDLSECLQSVKLPDGSFSNFVAEACLDPQNTAISKAQLASCMECLYGHNTKVVCSRDNFAIRPEAFLMHLYDQNQTDALAPKKLLTTNFLGVSNALSSELNLAANYNYFLEVNATNHLNNNSSKGYTKSFTKGISSDLAQYSWNPTSITKLESSINCNNESNRSIDIEFLNGAFELNTSVPEVGEYILSIVDKTWTAVDSDATLMAHHFGSRFLDGSDCVDGSSETQDVNSNTNNGCFTSSKHTNTQANLKYNDHKIAFHPYKYEISNNITLGLTHKDINTTDELFNFVYMADISQAQDINMSVQFNSTIKPQGYNAGLLSNFVRGCFAKPIDINITKSDPLNNQLEFIYILSDKNNTTNTISANIPPRISQDANLTTTNTFFQKDMSGVLNTTININLNRKRDKVANPEDINYSKLSVWDPRTFLSADLLSNKTAQSNVFINGNLGQNITHYFGRTAAKKTRIVCDSFPCISGANQEPDVLIYYEAYCYAQTNANSCNKDLIPKLGIRHIQRVDSRWYVNPNHQEANDGNLTQTSQIADGFVRVANITNKNNYTKDSTHIYNGNAELPYKAHMQSVVPRWLMYDEEILGNENVTNKHLIYYLNPSQWSGKHETNTTTNTQKVKRVNRRTMW